MPQLYVTQEPHLKTTPITIDTILVATDFSPVAKHAFETAAEVARDYGARLVVAHVIHSAPATPLTGAEVHDLEVNSRAARQLLEELAKCDAARDLEVQTKLAIGAVGDELLDMIRTEKTDLLVVGTHGGRGLEKLLLGSMAEALFRSSPVPVLTVGPHSDCVHVPFKRILFASDLSGYGLRAAQYATSIAEENDAEISFLHVLDQEESDRKNAWSEAHARLRELAPLDADQWCRPEFLVRSGDPAEAILNIAREQRANLIVLSVKMPLMGDHATWSIASRVVRESTCPVLTVRDRL